MKKPSTDDSYKASLEYLELGEHAKAGEILYELIETLLSSQDSDPVFVANVWLATGVCHMEQEQYSKALDAFTESLHIVESTFGRTHPAVAAVYVNIGLLYMRQGGKKFEAAKVLNKAKQLCDTSKGSDRLALADILHNLGCIEDQNGKLADAMALYSRSALIRSKLLGDQHPLVATTYSNMGQVLRDQMKYAEALEHHLKALAARESAFGSDHLDTAESCYFIACIYQSINKSSLAHKFVQRALAVRSEQLEPNDPALKEVIRLARHLDFQRNSKQRTARPRPSSATMAGRYAMSTQPRRHAPQGVSQFTTPVRDGPAMSMRQTRAQPSAGHTAAGQNRHRPRSAPRGGRATGTQRPDATMGGRMATPSAAAHSAPERVPFSEMIRRRDFR